MKLLQDISIHRNDGWQGQYSRMIRWANKFLRYNEESNQDKLTHEYYDLLITVFQNIFYLKDWIMINSTLKKEDLNSFINKNWHIGLCRDICNGTKHFDINNPSVDSEFAIIRDYNPLNKILNEPEYKVVIIADGSKIQPDFLIRKCIDSWSLFIKENLD